MRLAAIRLHLIPPHFILPRLIPLLVLSFFLFGGSTAGNDEHGGVDHIGGGHGMGTFRLSYYYIVQEEPQQIQPQIPPKKSPEKPLARIWPLYAPGCRDVIARTTRGFHYRVSREGTGLLRDGRLINFASRCSCAKPGFMGSRICYAILDREQYPWGRGAPVGESYIPLAPFRSVAVDPIEIPIGTRLYIPAFKGRRLPNGRVHDGCFRADDTGLIVLGRLIDLFAGKKSWAQWASRQPGLHEVRIYKAAGRCKKLRSGYRP